MHPAQGTAPMLARTIGQPAKDSLMKRTIIGSLAVAAAVAVSLAAAQNSAKPADTKAAPPAEMQLPPGMTMEEMQAYMAAATPGPMHEHLMKGVGTWTGTTKSWMDPDSAPSTGTCNSTITALMDGKFTKVEIDGDMPGMGPFKGMGLNGFDNVSKSFQSTWIDNMGTGMMQGTGTLSADGKVLTWNFNFHCPITKKPAVMREVETVTGPNSMTLEMFGPHPKTGKEFKMMEIAFTRSSAPTGKATATGSER